MRIKQSDLIRIKLKSRIRLRIKVKSRIRIRVKGSGSATLPLGYGRCLFYLWGGGALNWVPPREIGLVKRE
jgi:hypothetical protein